MSKHREENVGQQDWLTLVQQQVKSLRYGVVQIVVHDGRVTQVEKTEKVRLEQSPTGTVGGKEKPRTEQGATGRPDVPIQEWESK